VRLIENRCNVKINKNSIKNIFIENIKILLPHFCICIHFLARLLLNVTFFWDFLGLDFFRFDCEPEREYGILFLYLGLGFVLNFVLVLEFFLRLFLFLRVWLFGLLPPAGGLKCGLVPRIEAFVAAAFAPGDDLRNEGVFEV
jgi:hypothetical protein